VTVKSGVFLWDGIRIEDDVFIGPAAVFVNDRRPRSKQYPEEFQKTRVCRGASIGANATILGGVRIGEYSMIGAGSVVTGDVKDYGLYFGNPARLHGYVCSCGNKLSGANKCLICEREYTMESEVLKFVGGLK